MRTINNNYANLLRQGRVSEYRHALAKEGLCWWFNMDVPRLAMHLRVLPRVSLQGNSSLRLELLTRLIDSELDESALSGLYVRALAQGDWEAASAAAGGGIAAVRDSGYDFRRFLPWLQRIEALLVEAPVKAPLARASLLGFKANAQIIGEGDLAGATETCHRLLLAAEEARSPSLCVFHAALQTWCHLWRGSLISAGVLLHEADYLCAQCEVSPIAQVFLRASQGRYHSLNGAPDKAREILEEASVQPVIDTLPPPAWLLLHTSLLFAIANCVNGDNQAAQSALCEEIYQRVVPRQNAFYHSDTHFSLGIAALGLGQPRLALVHAQGAIDHGVAARSAITECLPALLKGQALADLGLDEEALGLFETWMPIWRETGFCAVAATAAQELARIHLRRGRTGQARGLYARARAVVPAGDMLPLFHRPQRIARELHEVLSSTIGIIGPRRLIRVHCLGGFRIEIGEHVVHDRKWRGGRTKTLLKALIVFGGEDIAMDHLADLLWPDTDGDLAYRNLKVMIWRLRRLGLDGGQEPLPWLRLRHGRLSLGHGVCEVDALRFVTDLKHVLGQSAVDGLALRQALDRYQGDFLPTDISETWIIGYREQLRRLYLNGVLSLVSLPGFAEHETKRSYLQRALTVDPLDERVYQKLMQSYLAQGYPAKALEVYHTARNALERDLSIAPGPALMDLADQASGRPGLR